MSRNIFSTRKIAQALGVSEASIKRWCDKGHMRFERTPGGHRRIPFNSVISFLRDGDHQLVRPELLDLPATIGKTKWTLQRAQNQYRDALLAGDEPCCRQIIFSLYLAKHSLADIFDLVIARAFHDLGTKWQHGSAEIYQESRGMEITHQVLYHLKQALPICHDDRPLAIGTTLANDPYHLPSLMAEMVFTAANWRAEFYGINLPSPTLINAIQTIKPKLFWISVSAFESQESFISNYHPVWQAAQDSKVTMVLGGRKLTDKLRHKIKCSAYCDNMNQLSELAVLLGEKYSSP
jgi:excisionase family DNA binding protein